MSSKSKPKKNVISQEETKLYRNEFTDTKNTNTYISKPKTKEDILILK